MLKNFITVAFRNLRKTAFYSLLNIMGLSIGLASGLIILLFVYQELSYDTFHSKHEQIYRIWLNGKMAGQELDVAVSSPPVGPTATNELPEVKSFVRIRTVGEEMVRFGDKVYTEKDNVMMVDSSFFSVFDFHLLKGDANTCLTEPQTAVISERLAQKYFDSYDVLGKTLVVGDFNTSYKITGLVENPPSNSHINFDLLYSMPASIHEEEGNWFSNGLYTYLLVEKGTDPAVLDEKLGQMTERHLGPLVEQAFNTTMEEFKKSGNKYGYHPQALAAIHLDDFISDNPEVGGNRSYLYIFSAVALFIIAIACINFMNMATARSAGRAKEVGLRKTLGAFRSHLIIQFIAESVIITIIATFIALIITSLCLGMFNEISGKQLEVSMLMQPEVIVGIALLVILVGVFAGSYPAFYLSHFNPAAVLKGQITTGMRSRGIRNGLVVFQFFVSIFLIVSTLLIYRQVEYTRGRDIGFDKENLIILSQVHRLEGNRVAFKEAITGSTHFSEATYSNNALPEIRNKSIFRKEGVMEDHIVAVYSVDYDYLETMDMRLVEGRNFSRDFATDTAAIILNQAAVKEFGLSDPLSEHIISFEGESPTPMKVIAVVEDFNFETLKQPATPLLLRLNEAGSFLAVRIPAGDPAPHLAELRRLWGEYAGDEPFSYRFVDDEYARLFDAEERMGTIFTIFSILAVVIASIGLFGLAAFTAERRTREVGIRKVLGASVSQLVLLLSKDFAILVAIAFAISIPVVYYVMGQWLMGFAYRIDIGWWVFVLAGLMAFLIAFTTVSFQSFKAARSNPVNSLKSE
ncbi:ABC transporter permease [Roseivirga sp. BDSF3-8]|uniref:ABC transporter permease n=1 Tax=Roseivirga sp. BDSF3-8 TaxID=3241598 RepID=UPI003531DE30